MLNHHPKTSNWAGQTNTLLFVTPPDSLLLSSWTYSKTPYSILPTLLYCICPSMPGTPPSQRPSAKLSSNMSNLPTLPTLHITFASFTFPLGLSTFPFAFHVAHQWHDLLERVRQLFFVFGVVGSQASQSQRQLTSWFPGTSAHLRSRTELTLCSECASTLS